MLRRIVRRALRHGHKLGQKNAFFYKIVPDLVAVMSGAYPELTKAGQRIADVLLQEETRFGETLSHGMEILQSALAGGAKTLDGETAFKLYDTYGFPLDLTADVCRERGVSVDETGFESAMTRQREQARASGKFRAAESLVYSGEKTVFTGYDHLQDQAKVAALYVGGVAVKQLKPGDHAIVVLNTTPFYAESGGQVGDSGLITSADGARFEVIDTIKIAPDVFGHHGHMVAGAIADASLVAAHVNEPARTKTIRNHSATHLMHKALRDVLGTHVQQKGSLVDADKTRFDFAHQGPLTLEQIEQVETIVNEQILKNAAAKAQVMSFDDAVKGGAMALFGEKYGADVRVLDIGFSRELCGGVHVARTGDIGFFKIVSQGGVAAGIRRVEAVTGTNALAVVQAMDANLSHVAGALKATPSEVNQRLQQVLDHVKALEKELAQLKSKIASSQGKDIASQAIEYKGIKILAQALPQADAKTLRDTMDQLKSQFGSAAIVLAAVIDGKVQLAAGVTADLTSKVKAGELVNFVALQVGGKGGGRPDMAMAGGTDPSQLDQALASVQDWVQSRL